MGKYSVLRAHTNEQTAFSQLLEAYGSEDTQAAVSCILSRLEEVNTKTIDANPITRIRSAIQTLNRNLGKMEVEVNGRTLDTKHIRFNVPECAQEKQFTALGKYQGRTAKLELIAII